MRKYPFIFLALFAYIFTYQNRANAQGDPSKITDEIKEVTTSLEDLKSAAGKQKEVFGKIKDTIDTQKSVKEDLQKFVLGLRAKRSIFKRIKEYLEYNAGKIKGIFGFLNNLAEKNK